MNLKRPLPPNRSLEQVKNHYLVEKSLAEKLKSSNREERKLIYATMYEELFSKVPDHPRLTRRESKKLSEFAVKRKLTLLSKFLDKSHAFAEFAPGDCKLANEVAKKVKYAYGIDISDQRNPNDKNAENFRLIVYDGYILNEIKDKSLDIVYSNNLIEHFHPEDMKLHFQLVYRLLKKGGKYVFRTPHALTGPHDISQYFSDEPECFHLKEWSYNELWEILKDLEYSKFCTHWYAKGLDLRMPYTCFAISEHILEVFPKRYIRTLTKYLIPSVYGVAIK